MKCDPEKAIELREKYDTVTPGYHMNKTHWNTVDLESSIPPKLIKEWIDHSYELVVGGLSQKDKKRLLTHGRSHENQINSILKIKRKEIEMIKPNLFLAFLLMLSFNAISLGQTQDTVWQVPELDAFHEVIYPIWHSAYPEKDYAALKKFVDEVNIKAKAIYTAQLPGIQRERQLKWNEGIAQFQSAVEDYYKYTAADDNEGLLKAAENLHSKYEMLVRIIRPVLKEIDEFHKVLYVVYHDYLPNKKYKMIIKVSDDLVKKAKTITAAKLPARLESKKDAFNLAAAELLTSTQDLKKRVKSKSKVTVDAAVENMHSKYEKLAAIFE